MRTKLEGFFNTLAPPMPRARTWSLVWPGSSMGLSNATLLSLAFHLSLLALTFSSLPAKERVLNDNSLQIVLINTKTREIVNDKPQALAQSTLW
jgi:hypothetical protein